MFSVISSDSGSALKRLPVLFEKYGEARELLSLLSIAMDYRYSAMERIGAVPMDAPMMEQRLSESEPAFSPGSLPWAEYVETIRGLADVFIAGGTEKIKEKARLIKELSPDDVKRKLDQLFGDQITDSAEGLILNTFVQPYLILAARNVDIPFDGWLKDYCPVCGTRPSVTYLTDGNDMEGGRYCLCPLCHTSWRYARARCISCGITEDKDMRYSFDESAPEVIMQCCDQCKTYIKIVDLRKDGLAVPEMDDIASIRLDMWAGKQGYAKYHRNILGY